MSSATTPQAEATKSSGADFWNANPCGGEWGSHAELMTWYQATEPYIFQLLAEHPWDGVRTLEVGCGQGIVTSFLAQRGAAMRVLDMSAESVRRTLHGARSLGLGERVSGAVGDAERLGFDAERFERVVSIGVLHHSPDTARGVAEIHRVLEPGGTAIVMLYRSGNPKWWATRTCRGLSWLLDAMCRRPNVIAGRLQARQQAGVPVGTALLELFGVPVLQAFSNRQARRMFGSFREVRITNHVPGFERLIDVLPVLRFVRPILRGIDRLTRPVWGFYQVIEARK